MTPIINHCIKKSTFPDDLKYAQITPIKKSDEHDKKNYRPVSVLTSLSKVFEKCLNNQLQSHVEAIFEPLITAYRKGQGCQTLLLNMVTEWKGLMDDGFNIGILTTDLSSAFDSLPQPLLIAKLRAYNLSLDSCQLIASYLHKRKQRAKISNITSDWAPITKGVAQGSIIGPLAFNLFVNDLFYRPLKSTPFNYADDSSVFTHHRDINVIKSVLEEDAKILISWFNNNGMKANANKFQCMFLNSNPFSSDVHQTLCINNSVLNSQQSIKLLGVHIDRKLSFTEHVNHITSKASRQVNVLRHLSTYLDSKSKHNMYVSFIKSNFLYCSNVWYFCGRLNLRKMVKLEKRCLRFIYNDYISTYNSMLQMYNMDGIHVTLFKNILTEVFKCLNEINPTYLCERFAVKSVPYNLRNDMLCIIPLARTVRHGQNNFVFFGSSIWNKLPMNVKSAESIIHFKKLLTAELCTSLLPPIDV